MYASVTLCKVGEKFVFFVSFVRYFRNIFYLERKLKISAHFFVILWSKHTYKGMNQLCDGVCTVAGERCETMNWRPFDNYGLLLFVAVIDFVVVIFLSFFLLLFIIPTLLQLAFLVCYRSLGNSYSCAIVVFIYFHLLVVLFPYECVFRIVDDNGSKQRWQHNKMQHRLQHEQPPNDKK